MPKKSIAEASGEIYELLVPFKTAAERARIINSVLALLGDPVSPSARSHTTASTAAGSGAAAASGAGAGESAAAPEVAQGARAYFDHKLPKNKTEEFATAARFHELAANNAAATKADFERIISTQARRSFGAANFYRDIDNAKQAKFFNPGGSATGGYTLSHVGQKFVDALPDREKAVAVKKAAKGKPKRKAKPRVKPQAGKKI
jgi:hypothetical protein